MDHQDQQHYQPHNHDHPEHHSAHNDHPQPPAAEPPVPAFNQQFTPVGQPSTGPSEQPQSAFGPLPTSSPAVPPVITVPPTSVTPPVAPSTLMPQPVVRVLSPRGVEYVFMTIALFGGAIGLVSVLISLVNGETGFEVLSFPVALLLVSVPIFAGLFLRLKNAELASPELRLDASKRRSTQFIQIANFLVCFVTLIVFVTSVFAKLSGSLDTSLVKILLDVLVILVVSGGILAYYWRDEHRS